MNEIEWPVIKKDIKVKIMNRESKINPSEIFKRYHFSGNPSNKDDVYAFLQVETSNGALKKAFIFAECFPEIYADIISKEWSSDMPFSQILYLYFNPSASTTCKICGAPVKFRTFKNGYPLYCSTQCANSDPEKKALTEQTVQQRYGVNNVFQDSSVKETIKHTVKERYGVDYIAQSKEIREKQKATCIEKYGVPTPFQMDDFQEKSIQTCRKKYGTDYATQSQEVKSKITASYIDKEGFTNPSYDPDVIDKRRETNFKNFDGKWFTQTDEMVQSNHELFLNRHKNIIGETDSTYIVSCEDNKCTLCESKTFEIDKNVFVQRSSQSAVICPIKLPLMGNASLAETELLDYIKSIYDGEIETGDRSIIPPLELDIVIPDKHIAIEFNGVFWHSDFNPRMRKTYHRDKSLKCRDKGYQLLHIWEDDWYNRKDIIKDYIKSKLGLCSKRIYARKCHVREIDAHTARLFVDSNHIQGYSNATYKIGLFYGDVLVSVMLVGKLRDMMGSKPKEGHYEIYRVVSREDTEVVGGFSKMLKYFERTYNPECIITYGDLCYTLGNVYLKCGFTDEGLSSPCYSWQINGVRYHRSNFMKCKLEECKKDPSLTEDQAMRSRHAYKVWDAGKIKFVKHYDS